MSHEGGCMSYKGGPTYMQHELSIGILGASGRMGQEIHACISTLSRKEMPGLRAVLSHQRSDALPVFTHSDVIVDFTHADALIGHISVFQKAPKPWLVGTTGLSLEHMEKLTACARIAPILVTPNTSLGVATMGVLCAQAAQYLGQAYDVEIVETHHRHKVDAPSGTCKILAQQVAAARRDHPNAVSRGNQARGPEDYSIGVNVMRGGGIFGEHTVRFLGKHDVLEIHHRALSRTLFAEGATNLACWLVHQKAGLYAMEDFLKDCVHQQKS